MVLATFKVYFREVLVLFMHKLFRGTWDMVVMQEVTIKAQIHQCTEEHRQQLISELITRQRRIRYAESAGDYQKE